MTSPSLLTVMTITSTQASKKLSGYELRKEGDDGGGDGGGNGGGRASGSSSGASGNMEAPNCNDPDAPRSAVPGMLHI
jgi:hypothetical protein